MICARPQRSEGFRAGSGAEGRQRREDGADARPLPPQTRESVPERGRAQSPRCSRVRGFAIGEQTANEQRFGLGPALLLTG